MLIQKKKRVYFPAGTVKTLLRLGLIVLCGCVSGLVNGFLGTGGGILLLPVLMYLTQNRRDAFASALFCMVPLSILSFILSIIGGNADVPAMFDAKILPLYPGGVIGGICGAWLLSKISLPLLSMIFSALLVYSGFRMVFA